MLYDDDILWPCHQNFSRSLCQFKYPNTSVKRLSMDDGEGLNNINGEYMDKNLTILL